MGYTFLICCPSAANVIAARTIPAVAPVKPTPVGNPGKMEYQGVYVGNRQRLFHVGPMDQGTNNIGEFLALVHGLAYLKKNNFNMPIYTDSANAIAWVRQKKCNTKLERTEVNRPIFDLIERAEKWLQTNSYQTQILKWETSIWGEIPADFGRK